LICPYPAKHAVAVIFAAMPAIFVDPLVAETGMLWFYFRHCVKTIHGRNLKHLPVKMKSQRHP
jgi:lauroyl/myristoyl acyltransferase